MSECARACVCACASVCACVCACVWFITDPDGDVVMCAHASMNSQMRLKAIDFFFTFPA